MGWGTLTQALVGSRSVYSFWICGTWAPDITRVKCLRFHVRLPCPTGQRHERNLFELWSEARSLECSTADCRRRMPSTSSSFVVAFGHLSLLLLPPQVSRWVELDLRRQQRLSKNFFDEFRGSTNPTKLSDIKPCKSAKSWFWNSETNLVWKRIFV